ncbi:OsmC family protein [Litchfieldia salsa]|uniref:Uncharacterized OsmC-related protein n=1 Tax=Litchfieldia salsa TaxID=930152 RepID=A0A1H0T6H2_9BACI|nr:OsmC family protein [Litchfieldia salsa]SDP49188.1 Uncharacterized OsmC-related protein [Litchfieldia salsa]
MADKMTFQVSGNGNGMQTIVTADQHTFTIDEPPNMGGQDKGPNPLSTFLGALAGCENVVANLVAKELNFDLQGIVFDVKGILDPKGLMGDPNIKPYFEKVIVNAKVKTSETHDRILELQKKTDSRCPIFTALKGAGIELDSTWIKD